jgi:5-methylcytosine-specific restriction endonuclease McrA
MFSGHTGRVKPCCHACRKVLTWQEKVDLGIVRTPATVERACAWCLEIFTQKWAGATHCGCQCAQRHAASNRGRSRTGAGKARRSDRERIAPGLTYTQRRALLAKWRNAGARCVYCPALATTTDHLIPLSRGGTNYEGNLAPCCKRCNSSKSDLLTSEWRWGKRGSGSVSYSPWLATALHRVAPVRVVKAKPDPAAHTCLICGAVHYTNRKVVRTCGDDECVYEYTKRQAREKYRENAGLPPTWDVPTRPQANRAA